MAWSGIDTLVLTVYFLVVAGVGLWAGRRERDTEDFFLGGRRQWWPVVGLSILATEVSALTFVAVPAESYARDWTYLQMYAGAVAGRLLIMHWLLPAYYRHRVTTVYEYLGRRFGPWTRTTASLLFLGSRLIASGLRLLAACLAVSAFLDWPLVPVIVLVAAAAVIYTGVGGIKAVLWTDALQGLVFLAAGAAALGMLFHLIPLSPAEALREAVLAGKLRIFTWDFQPNNDRAFWVLFVHATFVNLAALGTDQDLMQRMLTCPDLARSRRSLWLNLMLGLPVVCLFLLIGTLLYVYRATGAGDLPAPGTAGQEVFPRFLAAALPPGTGLRGLAMAGIAAAAMSSLDSALGAISSTFVHDLYRPWRRRRAERRGGSDREAAPALSPAHELRLARIGVVGSGVLLAGVAVAFAGHDELLWEAFRWSGLIFGGMLGVFLLGVLTRRGRDRANVAAMLSSLALLVALKAFQDRTGRVWIAWPWWIVLGTGWTMLWGMCFRPPRRA